MRDLMPELQDQIVELRKTAGSNGVLLYAEPGLNMAATVATYFAQNFSGYATLLAPPVLYLATKEPWTERGRGKDAAVFTPYQVRERLLLGCDVSAPVMLGRLEAFAGKKNAAGLGRRPRTSHGRLSVRAPLLRHHQAPRRAARHAR
jgi:hypothetical protein